MYKTIKRLIWVTIIISTVSVSACVPPSEEIEATISANVVLTVNASLTEEPLPTYTPYATATKQPTEQPLNTATPYPTQETLATATQYPTGTPYPTFTPKPTLTPSSIPPTQAPVLVQPTSSHTQSDPTLTHIALLDQMTLLVNILAEFQGLVGTLNHHSTTDCNRMIQIFDIVQTMPEMDVSSTDESVQQAYSAYRSAIAHFTKLETTPGDIVNMCKTEPENLDNIAEMQINAITLYVRQSINLMLNAWYAIGGS